MNESWIIVWWCVLSQAMKPQSGIFCCRINEVRQTSALELPDCENAFVIKARELYCIYFLISVHTKLRLGFHWYLVSGLWLILTTLGLPSISLLSPRLILIYDNSWVPEWLTLLAETNRTDAQWDIWKASKFVQSEPLPASCRSDLEMLAAVSHQVL